MISPALPGNEPERLAALHGCGILDTPSEERFDRIVRLACRQLGVGGGAVSLIDADRQWFKAALGLEVPETPRSIAFCAHAILQDVPLVVEDAVQDERFVNNPLVTAEGGIRFYAGAPLTTKDGHRLGTLCVLDSSPRVLTSDEEAFLRDMAAIVVDEIELSVATQELTHLSDALDERNRCLDAFVHTLSHDLAGPIRRIRTFSELLASDDEIPAETCIKHISDSAGTAERLLNDLREFFLADRTEADSAAESEECLGSALKNLVEGIEDSGCEINRSGDFPRVEVYSGLLVSLFRNLIGNAIKYRSEDRDLRVSIHGVDRGDVWECSIRDNGIGIEEKSQEKVFELLFRLHSEAEIAGSGMGLAICAKIVKRSQGTIRLESTLGEGTCVTFTLPKAAQLDFDAAPAEGAGAAGM